jgi:antitoxin component YwqK of YwqJK toxin-antitoxin module
MAGRTVGRRSTGADAETTPDGILRTMAGKDEPTPHLEHYGNGKVKLSGFHLEGEMHGDWTFFRLDGSVMRAGAFDRGRQVGRWRTFDRAGTLVKETNFGGGPTD